LGLRVVLVLAGTGDGPGSGNLALDGLLGAAVAWAGDVAHEELGAVALSIADRLRAQGGRPVIIPYGGSSVLGAQGYVTCGRELLAQAPDLHTVVTAIGSGGTMAGLVHALGASRVLGVDCGAASEPAAAVAELVSGLSGAPAAVGELRIRSDQVGAGYSELTEPVMSALTLAARTEGLILDPIYTGRALAGLAKAVEEREIEQGQRTVLLHSGGLPGLFGHPATVSRAFSGIQDLPAS
jgi:D-cysteine desulfhydrase